jgi:hypothetical protein
LAKDERLFERVISLETIKLMKISLDAAVASLPEPVSSSHVQAIAETILRSAKEGERDSVAKNGAHGTADRTPLAAFLKANFSIQTVESNYPPFCHGRGFGSTINCPGLAYRWPLSDKWPKDFAPKNRLLLTLSEYLIKRRHFVVSAVMPYLFIVFLRVGLLIITYFQECSIRGYTPSATCRRSPLFPVSTHETN